LDKWTLIWILVFPPAGVNKPTTWEYSLEKDLTMEECFAQLAVKDAEYKELTASGEILGHEIYCRDPAKEIKLGN